ncbi:MAG: TonB-dependent receptor [Prevotellaceae bacterium]|jgi:outer membrane cobalamin receptor|nr:TonB-dependent receptor [Prevotellaceae bacterium]
MKSHLSTFLCLFFFCTSSRANPQIIDSSEVYTIDQAMVYGARTVKETVPVQNLSGEELKKLSTFSVADAIRYFSGVQIKDYGGVGGLKTINVRSLGTHHTGIFYDGVELGNAQNGVIDLARFSTENMESISLYNGQKSGVIQSAKDFASASSVYMYTRTPVFEETKRNNIKAGAKAGSFGTINPSLLWERRLSAQASSSFNAEYLYTDGRYKFHNKGAGYDSIQTRQNSDVQAIRIEQGFSGKSDGSEWRVKAYFYGSERGYPGPVGRDIAAGQLNNQDRQSDFNLFLQTSFRKIIGKKYEMLLNGKCAYDYLHYMVKSRSAGASYDQIYRQSEVYLSSANMFTLLSFLSLNLSADFQWNGLNSDKADFVSPERYTALGAAAASLHFARFKLQTSLLASYVSNNTSTETIKTNKYSPAVVIFWQPFEKTNLNFRAFYKDVFRMPTFNDLYYDFIGNKNLEPEYTTQYNFGFSFARNFASSAVKRIEIQADAYFNEVRNKIIAVPLRSQSRWTMFNLGRVEIFGFDASAKNEWTINKNCSLNSRISYSFQRARDVTNPSSSAYLGQLQYIPRHSGSFILGLNCTSWTVNYSLIYTGERFTKTENIEVNRMEAWTTSDLALGKTFAMKRTKIKLIAEVNNLFDRQYSVVHGYPVPGRNFYFTLNINI